jgi:hypothetical protein
MGWIIIILQLFVNTDLQAAYYGKNLRYARNPELCQNLRTNNCVRVEPLEILWSHKFLNLDYDTFS